MLSLQVKSGEYITIGEDIVIQIFRDGSMSRVAVKAPKELAILRGEVLERTEDRPQGLHSRRPKSPSQRRYDAQHREAWREKRETRLNALSQELLEIAEGLDATLSQMEASENRNALEGLRLRLLALLEPNREG